MLECSGYCLDRDFNIFSFPPDKRGRRVIDGSMGRVKDFIRRVKLSICHWWGGNLLGLITTAAWP